MRLDPAFSLETMQSRIKGTLLNLENLARHLRNALRDGPTMLRLERNSLEDQNVKSTLRDIYPFIGHGLLLSLLQEATTTPVGAKGKMILIAVPEIGLLDQYDAQWQKCEMPVYQDIGIK
jgi:hypothetical protein